MEMPWPDSASMDRWLRPWGPGPGPVRCAIGAPPVPPPIDARYADWQARCCQSEDAAGTAYGRRVQEEESPWASFQSAMRQTSAWYLERNPAIRVAFELARARRMLASIQPGLLGPWAAPHRLALQKHRVSNGEKTKDATDA